MSSIKLDLKQFKHLKSDAKSTTLQHKDGHILTMAHSGLSKPMQQQLAALGESAKQAAKSTDKSEAKADSAKLANGGEVADNYAKGGPVGKMYGSDASEEGIKKGIEKFYYSKPGDITLHPNEHGNHDVHNSKGKIEGVHVRKHKGRYRFEALEAEGGEIESKSSSTIHVPDTIAGIKQSETIKKEGKAEHGSTIVVHDKHENKKKEHGKVTMMAEGGIPEALDPNAQPKPPAVDLTPQIGPVATGVSNESQIDPEIARKRQIYNELTDKAPDFGEGTAFNPNVGTSNPEAFGPHGEAPKEFNPKAWQTAEKVSEQQQISTASQMAAEQQRIIAENQTRAAAGLPPLPVPEVPGQQAQQDMSQMQMPQSQGLAQQQQAPQNPMAQGMNDIEGMMKSGYQQKLAGINQQAEAQGQLGAAQAEMLNNQVKAQQDAQIAFKKQFDDLEQERQAHMKDIQEGHIDPNKYWTGDAQGNGSHSKLMTGIGMILAGFNPTNSPNAAIEFLKHNMNMNLEAQKQNLGAKQNLLAANLRQFGNLKDATDMTRIMQHDVMQNELMSAAAKAQNPMAKAAALQAAGQLKMETAPMMQQFAMRRAMMHLADGGHGEDPSNTAAAEQMIAYARMTNPEMAKEMESRLIPGVGMAKVPVPPAAREEMIAKQSLAQAGQDLLQYSKTHSNIIPGTPEYNFGVTKALAFQQKIREGLLGTVFRESEKPLLEKFVNENPAGALKALNTQPQLKAILDSNQMGLNTQKQGYGLPVSKQQSAPEIKIINGVKYMRGPDGKAVRVK